MTAAGDGVNVFGLWWKATSAIEAMPAATARPPSVATIGLCRRWSPTPWCRGATGDGSIGFISSTSVESVFSCGLLVRAFMPELLVRGSWVVMVDASARGIARGGLLPMPL